VRIYDKPLLDVAPSPVEGIEFGVLRPSEYAALVATGRHHLAEIVRLHYTGLRCFVASTADGVIASYVWVIAGRPIHVPERGQELALGPDDIYFTDAYTRPAFRGRGLYPRLFTYGMAFYAREGRRRAFLVVRDTHKASLAGIDKAGFSLVGHEQFTKWLWHEKVTRNMGSRS
jgi:ribosomal protein S18 acetylase RimI-like enzyme